MPLNRGHPRVYPVGMSILLACGNAMLNPTLTASDLGPPGIAVGAIVVTLLPRKTGSLARLLVIALFAVLGFVLGGALDLPSRPSPFGMATAPLLMALAIYLFVRERLVKKVAEPAAVTAGEAGDPGAAMPAPGKAPLATGAVEPVPAEELQRV